MFPSGSPVCGSVHVSFWFSCLWFCPCCPLVLLSVVQSIFPSGSPVCGSVHVSLWFSCLWFCPCSPPQGVFQYGSTLATFIRWYLRQNRNVRTCFILYRVGVRVNKGSLLHLQLNLGHLAYDLSKVACNKYIYLLWFGHRTIVALNSIQRKGYSVGRLFRSAWLEHCVHLYQLQVTVSWKANQQPQYWQWQLVHVLLYLLGLTSNPLRNFS